MATEETPLGQAWTMVAAGGQVPERFLDLADMLVGRGRHHHHQREYLGNSMRCSCGMRADGALDRSRALPDPPANEDTLL